MPPSGCSGVFGPTASGSSSSARSRAATAAATACSPSWPSGWASACVATGNVHAHDRSRAALQDALVAVRLGAHARRVEPERRGNSSHALAPPGGDGRRASPTTPAPSTESGRLAERLRVRPHRGPRLLLPGRRGPARRPQARRALPGPARTTATRGRPHRARGRGARSTEELRVIRALGLSGFFLLHRDMLELAREVAVEVRGARRRPRAAAARPRARLERLLDRLLPDRPLARGPGRERLSLGRFLNEELTALPDIDLDFPRDVRERADPARARALRRRPLGARGRLPHLPRPLGAIRDFGKALGLPPGEVERLGAQRRPLEGATRRAATSARRRARERARARRAGRRWRSSSPTPRACRAT